jgi:hypothetical protein
VYQLQGCVLELNSISATSSDFTVIYPSDEGGIKAPEQITQKKLSNPRSDDAG